MNGGDTLGKNKLMKAKEKGLFIISLDFELNWGVHDVFKGNQYAENLSGTREAIDQMLELFKRYQIHATWATVGMLFFDSKQELLQHLPMEKPAYINRDFSPYEKLDEIGENEKEDPYHYGASIIKKIHSFPNQEIGTHTFSHYYCLEQGQTIEQFEADLKASIQIKKSFGHPVKSIVFPRNQLNNAYLDICEKHGIQSYRGNERSWIYKESKFHKESALKRAIRLADSYINITGHNTYPIKEVEKEPVINLPSSRFLRPYNTNFKGLEKLRLKRIKNSIAHAARKGEVYHLWWHPHNFGKNVKENFQFLQEILQLVDEFVRQGSLCSLNMEEAAELVYVKKEAAIYEKVFPQSQYET